MTPRFCFIGALILFPFLTTAQGSAEPDNFFRLTLRKEIRQMPWRDSVYRFTRFLPSKITFEDNFTPDQQPMLNYNMYLEHMFMVNNHGDTASMKDLKMIKMVTIGDVNFLYSPPHGYVEIVTRTPVALGMKHNFVYLGEDMGLGQPFRTRTPTDIRGIRTDFTRVYKRGASYYFIDTQNKVHLALPATIHKLFPTFKHEIRAWIKEHHTNFKDQNDLLQLLEYCNSRTTTAQQ